MDNNIPIPPTQNTNMGIPVAGFTPIYNDLPTNTTDQFVNSPIPQTMNPTQVPPSDVNPLRQYFRRPTVHIKLPSGGIGYPVGAIDMPETGELPVYPMTAIDEITARTPDALFNGSAVAELIRSCIPNIKDPWSVTNVDLDAILIGIKAAGSSGDMEIETTCPGCDEETKFGVNLMGMLSTLGVSDYNTLYDTGDLNVKFRPLTYREINDVSLKQFEIQREFSSITMIEDAKERDEKSHAALEKITTLTLELLSSTIEYIQTPATKVTDKTFILDFLKNCDRNLFVKLRDYNASLKEAGEIKPLNMQCPQCNHEYTQPFTLNPSDFFV